MIREWKQRELKFRIYADKVHWLHKEYEPINGIVCIEDTSIRAIIPNEHLVIVQDTGKVDTNGKRIFEGDIVNFLYIMTLPRKNSELEHIDYWYDGVIVMNKDNIWCIKRVGHDYYPLHEQDSDKIEITGNYFQHPELVEKYDLEIKDKNSDY